MKTIKNETYKGYKIEVKAEYKEDSIVSMNPEYNYDSLKIEVHKEKLAVLGSWSVVKNVPEESEVIEFRKAEKMKAYDSLNKTADKMIDKVKHYIDKEEREKEMTDGLPESLLVEVDKNTEEDKKDDLYDVIYTICEQAVKELDSKKTKEFLDNVTKALKRNKGVW